MNYKIIQNIKALESFIEWLPELLPHETYYVTLFARKKYCNGVGLPNIRSDKAQLKRFTSSKSMLLSKIKQLECPVGSYVQRDIEVPQQALALYITPNPRDMIKATKTSLVKLMSLFSENYNGYNIHAEVMSEIQKACSRKQYFDMDFDIPPSLEREYYIRAIVTDAVAVINHDCLTVLETRGGFHLLVDMLKLDDRYKKTWYNNLKALDGADKGSFTSVMPVPGCSQGDFVPYFAQPEMYLFS